MMMLLAMRKIHLRLYISQRECDTRATTKSTEVTTEIT